MDRPAERDQALVELFAVGDERIQDLILALNDPNKPVRFNAQIVIRYLGNELGMRALIESYKNAQQYQLGGPVPLPLRKWDYDYIRLHYLGSSRDWDGRSALYIYALALDQSAEARELLRELETKVKAGSASPHTALRRVEFGDEVTKLSNAALGSQLVDKAFFLSPDDRKEATAKIVGFSGSKDKVLVDIHTSAGALPLERYHVVLQRRGESWRFYSITRISVA
jgi:hypothetical protein